MTALLGPTGAFIALFAVAILIAVVAERVRIPAAVALIAVGTPFHPTLPFAFGDALFVVFLPPLVFEAAWNLDAALLRRVGLRVALLAGPGTIATALIVAGILSACGLLPFSSALLFGAIVAATDPVAVVAAFRSVTAPAALRTLVEAESLANDGVALVLFGFALAIAQGVASSLGVDVLIGIGEVVGGTAIGIAAGYICAFALRATRTLEGEVTITIAFAYAAYLGASALHCSGIFATAAGAVVLRLALERRPKMLSNAESVDRVWGVAAFIANAIVFFATGLLIQPERMVHEPLLVIVAVLAVLVSRVPLVLCAVSAGRDRLTVFLAGMRGALPLALALSLPASLPFRAQIIDATFVIVFVTIVGQGLPLAPLLRRMYGSGEEPA